LRRLAGAAPEALFELFAAVADLFDQPAHFLRRHAEFFSDILHFILLVTRYAGTIAAIAAVFVICHDLVVYSLGPKDCAIFNTSRQEIPASPKFAAGQTGQLYAFEKIFPPIFCAVTVTLRRELKTTIHTKHILFHPQVTTGVYAVSFDLFRYLSRRRGC
jgi:hypothetical protein